MLPLRKILVRIVIIQQMEIDIRRKAQPVQLTQKNAVLFHDIVHTGAVKDAVFPQRQIGQPVDGKTEIIHAAHPNALSSLAA